MLETVHSTQMSCENCKVFSIALTRRSHNCYRTAVPVVPLPLTSIALWMTAHVGFVMLAKVYGRQLVSHLPAPTCCPSRHTSFHFCGPTLRRSSLVLNILLLIRSYSYLSLGTTIDQYADKFIERERRRDRGRQGLRLRIRQRRQAQS